jgi:hypothetical protein
VAALLYESRLYRVQEKIDSWMVSAGVSGHVRHRKGRGQEGSLVGVKLGVLIYSEA